MLGGVGWVGVDRGLQIYVGLDHPNFPGHGLGLNLWFGQVQLVLGSISGLDRPR
jgi:hypothetical protein